MFTQETSLDCPPFLSLTSSVHSFGSVLLKRAGPVEEELVSSALVRFISDKTRARLALQFIFSPQTGNGDMLNRLSLRS